MLLARLAVLSNSFVWYWMGIARYKDVIIVPPFFCARALPGIFGGGLASVRRTSFKWEYMAFDP